MTNNIPGINFLAASIGYVIGKAAGDRIRKKRRQTYVELPTDRARRLMNSR